jgi:phage-related tail protein
MNNLLQPAYPVMPLQDNFKRLVVPVAGVNKLELFALEIFKCYLINNADGTDDVNELMSHSISQAKNFLNKLDQINKEITNEKPNEMAFFDR